MLMLLMRTLEQRLHCVSAKATEFLSSDEVSSRLGIPGGSSQEVSSPAGSSGKEKGILERLLQAVDLLNVMDKSRSSRLSVFDKIRSQIDVMRFSSDEVSDQEEKEDVVEIFKILREKAWKTLFDAFGIREVRLPFLLSCSFTSLYISWCDIFFFFSVFLSISNPPPPLFGAEASRSS